MENLAEEVKSTLMTDYKTRKLEKELNFSDTFANKMTLADEYFRKGNLDNAIQIYESCLEGNHKTDKTLLTKLINAKYQQKDYEGVIQYGEPILEDRTFHKSDEIIYVAWAHHELGQHKKAQLLFEITDIRFSNYWQRLEYAKYLNLVGNRAAAKNKLEGLMEEIDSMSSYEQRHKKNILRQIKGYYGELMSDG